MDKRALLAFFYGFFLIFYFRKPPMPAERYIVLPDTSYSESGNLEVDPTPRGSSERVWEHFFITQTG